MITEGLVTNKKQVESQGWIHCVFYGLNHVYCFAVSTLSGGPFFSVTRSKSALRDAQEKQADNESDQNTTFMRNTMISGTMVSGEASETDDEDDDGVTDQEKTNEGNDTLEAARKPFKDDEELLDAEVCDLDFESGTEVKTKRQKIVYKFDS